jgi:hypothetical protein
MEQLTLEGLKALAQHEQTPKISAFMPLNRSGPDMQQNRTRYKNMIGEMEEQLTAREMPDDELTALLEPARILLDDDEFWDSPPDGLAVFAAPGVFQHYRLPYTIDEKLVISPHFSLTPMMPMFNNNGRYYILAVSQNHVRMFGANRYSIWPIQLPGDAPLSIDEALKFDVVDKQLQMHSSGGQGTAGGIFHGSEEVDNKERIQRYLNMVDAALKPLLREQRVPLVLAAVDYLHPIYHDQSEYAHIMEKGIIGNPENMKMDDLHAQSWPIVEPVFHQEIDAAKEVYGNLSATERSGTDLREIVSAAVWARVDTLFVAEDSEEWGTFDPASSKVVIRKEGPRTYEDLALVDFAATHTMLNGGTVYVLPKDDMPADKPLAAIFRWEQEK